jgi:hypothetical protein
MLKLAMRKKSLSLGTGGGVLEGAGAAGGLPPLAMSPIATASAKGFFSFGEEGVVGSPKAGGGSPTARGGGTPKASASGTRDAATAGGSGGLVGAKAGLEAARVPRAARDVRFFFLVLLVP